MKLKSLILAFVFVLQISAAGILAATEDVGFIQKYTLPYTITAVPDNAQSSFTSYSLVISTGTEYVPKYLGGSNPYTNAGQDTAFVWGRTLQKTGIILPYWGLAKNWTASGFQYGDQPKSNSIAVYSESSTNTVGRVLFIEEVVGDRVYYNEANNPVDLNWGTGYGGVCRAASINEMKTLNGLTLKYYIYTNSAAEVSSTVTAHPAIIYSYPKNSEVQSKSPVLVSAKTNSDTSKVAILDMSGVKLNEVSVATSTTGLEKVWDISFTPTASGPGRYILRAYGTQESSYVDNIVSVRVSEDDDTTANRPQIFAVTTSVNPVSFSSTCIITIQTDKTANSVWFSINGQKSVVLTSGYTENGDRRVWTIPWIANVAGTFIGTAYASNSSEFTAQYNFSISVLSQEESPAIQKPAVNSIVLSKTSAVVGESIVVTIYTNILTEKVCLVNESQVKEQEKTSGYTTVDNQRIWQFTWQSEREGNRQIAVYAGNNANDYGWDQFQWFHMTCTQNEVAPSVGDDIIKLTQDKVGYAVGDTAVISVLTKRNVTSVWIRTETNDDISKITEFEETLEGRIFRLQWKQGQSGTRNVTICASDDTGRESKAALAITISDLSTQNRPIVQNLNLDKSYVTVGEQITITLITNIETTKIGIFDNDVNLLEIRQGYVKTSATQYTWTITWVADKIGDRSLEIRAGSDVYGYNRNTNESGLFTATIVSQGETQIINTSLSAMSLKLGDYLDITLYTTDDVVMIWLEDENGIKYCDTNVFTLQNDRKIWNIRWQTTGKTGSRTLKLFAIGRKPVSKTFDITLSQ